MQRPIAPSALAIVQLVRPTLVFVGHVLEHLAGAGVRRTCRIPAGNPRKLAIPCWIWRRWSRRVHLIRDRRALSADSGDLNGLRERIAIRVSCRFGL
jgi:hypothetical protein